MFTSQKSETVKTYNDSAEALAKKFDALTRVHDIDYVFSLCKKENPSVYEIGCGNGRDAEEISKHTNNYHGIDISEKLLALAKEKNPTLDFTVDDVETIEFPNNIDIVFAFASLIHVKKESFSKIMNNLFQSVNPDGLVFISLKYSPDYEEVTKTDEFGTRTYWHYSENDVTTMASGFEVLKITRQDVHNQEWIDVLCQKK